MATMYYDNDADLNHLMGKKLCVLGYGSQGRGQSLNLRDSGLDVTVGLRKGSPSFEKAEAEGMQCAPLEEALDGADLVAMLTPDTTQADLYNNHVAKRLKPGAALLFSHGFNLHFKTFEAPKDNDLLMVAPKGPGNLVREVFQAGGGVPCLFAVDQDASGHARELALAYAKGVGGTRAGVLETTFAEETETDLFGEQAVLCGGATALVKAGFETLVEAGYQPEVAYFECLHELKLIVDLMYREGMQGMRKAISDTAKYGDLTRGDRVVDAHTRERMREVLNEIRDGRFAKEWMAEDKAGRPTYDKLMAANAEHQLEQTGAFLRERMSWLKKSSTPQAQSTPDSLYAGRQS